MPRFEDLAAEGQALVEVGGAVVGVDVATQAELDAVNAAKAPLESPALTGTPTVPTAPAGTNSTQAASTAFVKGEVDNATSGLSFGFPHTASWRVAGGTLSAFQAANMAWAYRSLEGGPITKVGLHVGVQSGNINVAVYANSGTGRASVPGALKGSSGSVACPAPGFAEVALGSSVAVEAGDWFYFACDNTAATFRQLNVGGGMSDLYAGLTRVKGGAFPAADPAGSGWSAASDRQFVLVGVA